MKSPEAKEAHTNSEDGFLNSHDSCSPKLVSFPCSLWRLIWVYTVCIGLSVPIFMFFKFLICASFVCISDEKRLYKLNLFFSRSSFAPQFHVMLLLRACGFFMRGKGNNVAFVTVAFSGYFNNHNVLNVSIM